MLKETLTKHLSISQEAKTRRLLEHKKIGDRKPSQFFRHLRDLAGSGVAGHLVRPLWISRLLSNIQTVLVTQRDNKDLDKVAELADAIADIAMTAPQAIDIVDTTKATSQAIAVQAAPEFDEAALNLKLAQLALNLRQELASTIRAEINSARVFDRSRHRSFKP